MPHKIFISYRRDDSAGHAGRVHDRLEKEFGRDLLFMDVDAIALGADFAQVLAQEVAKCDVLLALIGPHWLDARDEGGSRRLDNPDDFVRIEIAAALKRGIPVIPILLEGTPVPEATDLPNDLKALALRHALDVRHASFHADMDKLIRSLRGGSDRDESPSAAIAGGPIPIEVGTPQQSAVRYVLPGNGKAEWFKDLDLGPEMVVVPSGSFVMGSPADELARLDTEGPQHVVTIARPFAVGRCSITRGQFARFVEATGHDAGTLWRGPGFAQDDSHPVVCVNWTDARAYASWLAQTTGRPYRLPSEAEREYVTRARTTTPFWWGSSISTAEANYNGKQTYGDASKGEVRNGTVPVTSFSANPWGLYNVHGNIWEWCEDVWHLGYQGAPSDGSPWSGHGDDNRRVIRGGSWLIHPGSLRAASRWGEDPGDRVGDVGFRVARALDR